MISCKLVGLSRSYRSDIMKKEKEKVVKSMRKMRLYKREIKDKHILREIVAECDVVRIGAMDQEGMFIVPVNFGYEFLDDGDTERLILYFHGAPEGRKAEAFEACRQVALEMDCGHRLITGDYTCSYSYAYRSIMGNGTVERLDSDEQKIYGLTKVMEHMACGAAIDFNRSMLERAAVYRITVESFTGKERS